MALTQNANVGLLNQTTTSTSFAVPTPTGFAAGDVLFCVLNVDSKSVTVTTPSGWTLDQDIQTSAALGNRTRTYWRVADGTEGASVTFALSGTGQRGSGTMLGFSGADTFNPIAGKATANNSTSSVNQNAPSVTPNTTGGILVCSASAFINGSYTPPAGMTEVSDQANVDTTTTVATQSGMTTAGTGTKTFVASTASASITTSTVIKPALVVTLTTPVGTASGDLLFAQVAIVGSSGLPDPTPPAGWTKIDGANLAGDGTMRLATFYKIAGGGEPSSYDFGAMGATTLAVGVLNRYAGPWANPPLDQHTTNNSGAFTSSTNAVALGVTVSQANSLGIISIFNGINGTVTPATGFTQNGGATRTYLLENTALPAGATGNLTSTLSTNSFVDTFFAVFTPGAAGTVVNAPVLAGSGALLAPLPKLTLAAPALTGSGLLPAPTPALRLTAPLLTGSGLLPAPSLALVSNPTIAAPVLAGSGLLPAPSVSAGIVVAAPLLTGSGQLLAGLPALSVSAPVLAGTGALLAGTPALTLSAPVLSGSGLMPAPSLSLSALVSAPVLSGSGQLLPGTPGLTLAAPVLSGSGLILNGSIALSQVIAAPVLAGSGRLPAPQLVIITPLPGWGLIQAKEPFALIRDASLKGAAMADGQPFGLIVAMDPSGRINRGEPFALIVDISPRGKG